MITLFRWLLLKQKEIKWKFTFWQLADKKFREIVKNPEEIEKTFVRYLIELIHNDNSKKANNN